MQTLNKQENIGLRIGIHIGDILTDENGIYGDSVNIASRIESLSIPGSILISEKLYDEVKNQEGISAKTLGYFELKNVKQAMQVYAITNSGITVPAREDLKGKVKENTNSIAVIPFASLSSDPENEFFCDGMTEELINVLSKIEGLSVTSRISSFAFKGKNEDIREIAAKLNVQKILEGSVRKAKDKVRITAQLINAADGFHLWSETYDRNIDDIFEVQDDISRTIANKFRQNLSSADHQKSLVKAPTDNMDAYKMYLQGIHFWNKQTLQDIIKAVEFFEGAVKLQPDFANPYGNLALLYWFLGYAGIIEADASKERCKIAAQNAIRYDPDSPYSHLAVGISNCVHEWRWQDAYDAFQQAMKISPNIPMTYLMLSWYYILMLQGETGVDMIKTALRIDPLAGDLNATLSEMYLILNRLEDALEASEHALSLEPYNMYALHMKAMTLGLMGNWDAALPIIKGIIQHAGDFPIIMISLGIAYAQIGQNEKAFEVIEKFNQLELQKPGLNLAYEKSLVYLHLDEMEKFYEYHEESIRQKSLGSIIRYGSPFMKNLRNDERLISIRKKLGLPY